VSRIKCANGPRSRGSNQPIFSVTKEPWTGRIEVSNTQSAHYRSQADIWPRLVIWLTPPSGYLDLARSHCDYSLWLSQVAPLKVGYWHDREFISLPCEHRLAEVHSADAGVSGLGHNLFERVTESALGEIQWTRTRWEERSQSCRSAMRPFPRSRGCSISKTDDTVLWRCAKAAFPKSRKFEIWESSRHSKFAALFRSSHSRVPPWRGLFRVIWASQDSSESSRTPNQRTA
jgi:hypothetical protein